MFRRVFLRSPPLRAVARRHAASSSGLSGGGASFAPFPKPAAPTPRPAPPPRPAFDVPFGTAAASAASAAGAGAGSAPGDAAAAAAARVRAVEARAVQFSAGASSDVRPRVAAVEAFDVAASALGSAPNFCFFAVSTDHAAMGPEAPEALWSALCRANGVSAVRSRGAVPAHVCLAGAAVSGQRFGGGGAFVHCVLGCIPDLRMDVFSFDALPTAEGVTAKMASEAAATAASATASSSSSSGPGSAPGGGPPPFLCLASLDAKVALSHWSLVSARMGALSDAMRALGVPTAGALYPPAVSPLSAQARREREASAAAAAAAAASAGGGGSAAPPRAQLSDLGAAVFYFNDAAVTGGAACAVLRSSLVRCDVVASAPSIVLRSGVVAACSRTADGALALAAIDGPGGDRPIDVVKSLYETALADRPHSKIFVAFVVENAGTEKSEKSGAGAPPKPAAVSALVPVSFRADPASSGSLFVDAPPGVSVGPGTRFAFVCDDAELDSEAAAAALLRLRRGPAMAGVVAATRSVVVEREGRHAVLASSAAALHFSHPGLNAVAAPPAGVVSVGDLNGADRFVPSVLQRCLGDTAACGGVYCPGQVLPFASFGTADGAGAAWPSFIASRSSCHVLLQGTS